MTSNSWRLGALLVLSLGSTTGCMVRSVTAVPATVETTSWIRQVQLRIEPAGTTPRVASALASSWHLVSLKVGRLDGAMPIRTVTFDPYDGPGSSRALDGLAPGGGYWVQADLMHVEPNGEQWVVGSGRLGGGNEDVTFRAGSNSVPIPVESVVAGGRLDMAPTPLRRPSRRATRLDDFIAIGGTVAPVGAGAATLPAATPAIAGPVVMAPAIADATDDEVATDLEWLADEGEVSDARDDEDTDAASSDDDASSDDGETLDWLDEDV